MDFNKTESGWVTSNRSREPVHVVRTDKGWIPRSRPDLPIGFPTRKDAVQSELSRSEIYRRLFLARGWSDIQPVGVMAVYNPGPGTALVLTEDLQLVKATTFFPVGLGEKPLVAPPLHLKEVQAATVEDLQEKVSDFLFEVSNAFVECPRYAVAVRILKKGTALHPVWKRSRWVMQESPNPLEFTETGVRTTFKWGGVFLG